MRRTIFITTLYIVLVRKKKLITINNDCSPGTSHSGGYSHSAVVDALSLLGYRHVDTARRYGVEKMLSHAIQVKKKTI